MDISPEYIKMCEKAPEIQQMRPIQAKSQQARYKHGDWYYYKKKPSWIDDPVGVAFDAFNGCVYSEFAVGDEDCTDYWPEPDANTIWLPRQDQLQEMMNAKTVEELLSNFVEFCGGCGWDSEWYPHDVVYMGSLEQVWLAYVMQFKHAKRWRDSVWVSIHAKKEDNNGQPIPLVGPRSIP